MQPIIVLTDFSAPANHAMLYAGGISSRLKAPMVLLNVYDFPLPPAAEPSTLVMPYEELLEQSRQDLEQAASGLQEKYPDLNLSLKSLMGDVARMSNELAEEASPFLIVIGSRKKHEGDLFGNTTSDVVTHSKFPVLSVPEHTDLNSPGIALLATDLSPLAEGLAAKLRGI